MIDAAAEFTGGDSQQPPTAEATEIEEVKKRLIIYIFNSFFNLVGENKKETEGTTPKIHVQYCGRGIHRIAHIVAERGEGCRTGQ